MLFRSKRFSKTSADDIVIDISEDAGIRKLHFGGDDTQSAMRISNPTELVLSYSRCVFGSLLFADAPRDMLLIGLGGGSIAKWVHEFLPETKQTVVELHQQVINVARSMFYLPEDDERLSVLAADGAAHVYGMPLESTDFIVMDAYSATGIAPPLATAEFFQACCDRLREGGVLAVNLWGSDKRFAQYCDLISAVFGSRILLLPARQKGNVIAFGFKRALNNPKWAELTDRAAELEARYPLEFREFVSDLARMNPHNDRRLFI
ncbi:fused MFS/spermidine synthase [Chitinilyticum piscinae]|uniref:Fused MFS/spermidine synthase n=1 Tax=Chitinilyticum piscinae TaxID=2866724 RepID=A0A8J7K0D6_9NEIS|nr:fused MFS/spermidine synthase [Chitinilyticum piscinae]MBE9607856.1 fused MFS/spermidine synthase [Chitinilyticum piscinae]